MSWEQRNADFCNAQTDAQMAYIEAEREVDRLQAENAKLREQIHWLKQGDILHVLTDQEYIDQCEREHLMQVSIDALDKENAKLRELVRETLMDYRQYAEKYGLPPYLSDVNEHLDARLRDLGIEVDA